MKRFLGRYWWMLVWLIAGLLLAAATVLIIENEDRRLRAEAVSGLNSIARLKSSQIAQWKQEHLRVLQDIVESPLVRGLLVEWIDERGESERRLLRAELERIIERHAFADILLLDQTGSVILSMTDSHPPGPAPLKEPVRLALRGQTPVLSDLYLCPKSGLPRLDAVAPIFQERGESRVVVGAVLLHIDPHVDFYPMLQAWPTASGSGEVLLVRRDGADALFLNDVRHQAGTALTMRVSASTADVPAAMAVRGQTGPVLGRDYRGVPVLAAIAPVPGTEWKLVAKVDEEEAITEWRRQTWLIIAAGLLVFIAATAVIWAGWQRSQKKQFRALFEMEAKRRVEETRFNATLMSIGDGVITTDIQSRVEMMNPAAEALTGWAQEAAFGKPLQDVFRIVSEETREPVVNPATRVLAEGAVVGLANHTTLIARDGVERPIADSGAPIPGPDGRPAGVVLVFRDQTEERARERALQESEERYRRIAGAVTDYIYTVRVEDGRAAETEHGATCEAVTGYTAEELRANPGLWLDMVHPEDRAKVKSQAEHILADDAAEEVEHRILRKDGALRWVRNRRVPRHGPDGALIAYDGLITDITERKQAEERYQTLFHQMLDGFALHEILCDGSGRPVDYRFLAVNPAFERFTGLQGADLIGRTVLEVMPQTESYWIETYGKVALGGAPAHFENYSSALGKHFEVTAFQAAPGQFVTIFVDITARKRAEEEREAAIGLLRLLNSKNNQRELIHAVVEYLRRWSGCEAVGIRLREEEDFPYFETRGFPEEFVEAERHLCARDLDGQLLRDDGGNPVLECMCGNVLCGRFDPSKPFFTANGSFWSNNTTNLLATTTETDRQSRTRNRCNGEGYESVALIPLRAGGKTFGLLQMNDRRPDRFTPELIALAERLADSLAIGLSQRRAMEQLRERESQLAHAAQIARLGAWEYDVAKDRFRFNDALYNLLHTSAAEQGGYDMTPADYATRFMHPDDAWMVAEEMRKALEAEDPGFHRQLEHRFRYADGGEGILLVRYFIGKDEHGKTIRTYGVNQDITEARRAEEAIRASEEKFRTLFDTMAQGVVYEDADGRIISANPAAEEILGVTLDQMQGLTSMDPRWRAIREDGSEFPGELHPMPVALRTGKEVRGVVHGVFNPVKGETRWILVSATPQFRPGEKRPYQAYASFMDITELKKAQAAVQTQLDELRRWHAVTLDREGRVLELKREVNELLSRLGEPPRYGATKDRSGEA